MGHFSFTCTVSNLPIRGGDKIRFFLLTENPYGERPCYMHDVWFPRTFPLKAKYNDYGSVEEVEEGPVRDVWMEGFQRDLIEVGFGDNSFHDLPATKDMSFDKLLEALWEQRVKVKRSTEIVALELYEKEMEKKGMREPTPPSDRPGIPTLRSVMAVIKAADLPLYGDTTGKGYLVDDVDWGKVRVRWDWRGHEGTEHLEKLAALLTDYATMISAGTGTYPHAAELTVCPKPGTKDFHGGSRLEDRNKEPLAVRYGMIREDVWQALLTQPIEGRYDFELKSYKSLTIDDYRAGVRKFAEAKPKDPLYSFGVDHDLVDSCPGSWIAAKSAIPFTVGLGEQWILLSRQGALTESFMDTVAEFAFISSHLQTLRHWWKPSYSVGPQEAEWDVQKTYLLQMLKVVDEHLKEDEELMGDSDEDDSEESDPGEDEEEASDGGASDNPEVAG